MQNFDINFPTQSDAHKEMVLSGSGPANSEITVSIYIVDKEAQSRSPAETLTVNSNSNGEFRANFYFPSRENSTLRAMEFDAIVIQLTDKTETISLVSGRIPYKK